MSARPEYSGFPLGEVLSKKTRVAVTVENDSNLGALAEMWLSQTEVAGLDDFVFLEIGEVGVGAGIIAACLQKHGHDSSFAGGLATW
jgi:predicted NBD/HSP70 family sugar kinase